MNRLVAVALASFLLLGCSQPNGTIGGKDIEGNFDAFINLRKNSLEIVTIDVYEDFTCPACQHFEKEVAPWLKKAYGSKLAVRHHYLVGARSPISAMVLYKTALIHGKEPEIASALFKLNLDHYSAEKNDPRVLALADAHGLKDAYLAAMADTKTNDAIRNEWKTKGANIAFFPSIVIQNSIITTAEPDNLGMIINSLLKSPPRQIRISTMAIDGVKGKAIIQ